MAGRVRGSGANYVQQTDVLLNLLNQRTKELQEQFQLSHSACLKLIQHNAELKEKIQVQNEIIETFDKNNTKGVKNDLLANISSLPSISDISNEIMEEINEISKLSDVTHETIKFNTSLFEYINFQQHKITDLMNELIVERKTNERLREQNTELKETAIQLIQLTQSNLINLNDE